MKFLDKNIPIHQHTIHAAPKDAQYVMENSHHNPIYYKLEDNQWWVRVASELYWRKSSSGEYWFKKGVLVEIGL